jgi:hypothetical protein
VQIDLMALRCSGMMTAVSTSASVSRTRVGAELAQPRSSMTIVPMRAKLK